jgi:chemotaxis protein MotB
MARKKKKHEEEHENAERWLVSYADFITLLFAFFVTMYAMSRVDGKKMGSAVESLQRALGSVVAVQITQSEAGVFPLNHSPQVISITPIQSLNGNGGTGAADREAFEKMAKEITKGIDEMAKNKTGGARIGLNNQIKFVFEKRGLVIRVSDHIFFNSGEASIRQEMMPILDILAQAIETFPNHIRIEGHTDNVPINTSRFPSNWELSTARATMIVRYLLDHFEFTPDQLSATGYAEFRPVETNETSDGRLQNRRVDFVILSSKEMELEPQKEVPVNKAAEKKESI